MYKNILILKFVNIKEFFMNIKTIFFIFLMGSLISCDAAQEEYSGITSIAYIDNKRLVVASHKGCKVYDDSFNILYNLSHGSVSNLVISPNKKNIAMISDKKIFLYSISKDKCSEKQEISFDPPIRLGLNNRFLIMYGQNFTKKHGGIEAQRSKLTLYDLISRQTTETIEVCTLSDSIDGMIACHPFKNRIIALDCSDHAFFIPIPFDGRGIMRYCIATHVDNIKRDLIASIECDLRGENIFVNHEKKGYGCIPFDKKPSEVLRSTTESVIEIEDYFDKDRSVLVDSVDNEVGLLNNIRAGFYHLSIACDINKMAAILRFDGVVELWDYKKKQLVGKINPPNNFMPKKYCSYAPRLLAFSSDGIKLSVAINNNIFTYVILDKDLVQTMWSLKYVFGSKDLLPSDIIYYIVRYMILVRDINDKTSIFLAHSIDGEKVSKNVDQNNRFILNSNKNLTVKDKNNIQKKQPSTFIVKYIKTDKPLFWLFFEKVKNFFGFANRDVDKVNLSLNVGLLCCVLLLLSSSLKK